MNPPKILVVEDEGIIALNIADSLEELGYAISGTCNSAEKALLILKRIHSDLVLMDVTLIGEMDGITAAKRIIENFNIPVLFLTGTSDAQSMESICSIQNSACILKPFFQSDLSEAIKKLLT